MFFTSSKPPKTALGSSQLFDETTFYHKFVQDLISSEKEVIIESPYISSRRMKTIMPVFEELLIKGVKIYVFTRDPKEHSEELEKQSESEIQKFEMLGIHTLICKGNHHRKIAILDRKVLWEGSLNILSQVKSREIMRRIGSRVKATEMLKFLRLERFLD